MPVMPRTRSPLLTTTTTSRRPPLRKFIPLYLFKLSSGSTLFSYPPLRVNGFTAPNLSLASRLGGYQDCTLITSLLSFEHVLLKSHPDSFGSSLVSQLWLLRYRSSVHPTWTTLHDLTPLLHHKTRLSIGHLLLKPL